MLIEGTSKYLLKKTRAKAKMYEYNIPENQHIDVESNVSDLLLISIGAIGNLSAGILRDLDEKDEMIEKSKTELEFASKFFDAFLNSKIDDSSKDYYLLLGSVAYFLCDYIGSSKVLANKINIVELDLGGNGIEKALLNLLMDELNIEYVSNADNPYDVHLKRLYKVFLDYQLTCELNDEKIICDFRKIVYEIGSPLELLLIDSLFAIFMLKVSHSAANLLPKYTGIDQLIWQEKVVKGGFIKELWPAQRRLGEEGVFNGKSAVIQMPTSAGKTKSISIAIYSAFLSERTSFAVIVAPFRSLCREISLDLENDFKHEHKIHVDAMSDVLQIDSFSVDQYKDDEKIVIVVTPEKLLYLLRKKTDLIEKIGLIVFDEGHLFDEPQRGTAYELLISTLKGYLKEDSQKILVSAVIPNAVQLNNWLNGDAGVVIADNTIKSTEKAIAITDWEFNGKERSGYLYFIDSENPEKQEFYVPRLIEITQINKLKRERNERFFPEIDFKNSKVLHNDIAIYYGVKLCGNGGVAVFCGKKDTANNILSRILKIEERGYNINNFIENSNNLEVNRICNLIENNYGKDNIYYKAAEKAVFVHHAGISNGIKISVEHAMRKGNLNFLVCTSTLAQGVNLPIRYLIISNVYQGKDRIKVRDFHNLIGRAGRSGIYTEGNIIISETFVYNRRTRVNGAYRWKQYKDIINVNNSEACSSMLLMLIREIVISDRLKVSFSELISNYYANQNFDTYFEKNMKEYEKIYPKEYEKYKEKVRQVMICLDSIESFLMSYLLEETYEECDDIITSVLENTLAYNLANEEERIKLLKVFGTISEYCINNTKDVEKRYLYSKSLLGIRKVIEIENWVDKQIENIIICDDTVKLFNEIFPLIYKFSKSKFVTNVEESSTVQEIGVQWISGNSYYQMLDYVQQNKLKTEYRRNLKQMDLDSIIGLCDNGFGYECILIISSLTEIIISLKGEENKVVELLSYLSSQLRYGLSTRQSIAIYEMGFSDRVVAIEISNLLLSKSVIYSTKNLLKRSLKKYQTDVEVLLSSYPSVFIERLKSIIG